MNIHVFNGGLLIGWLMLTVGGCLVHPGWGLVGGGVALLVLTFVSAWLAGVHANAPTGKR